MKKIQEHALEHGFTEIPQELLAKVKSAIKEVQANEGSYPVVA